MPPFASRKQALKYIRQKSRSLPIHECLVNTEWREAGIGNFFISRQMPSGNFVIAMFLVDIYCLGVKNALYNVNLTPAEYEELRERFEVSSEGGLETVDVNFFHNLIYGAIDFAEEYGFQPHRDFAIAEYLLDPGLITDEIDEIEFGQDGLPHFFQGPNDSNADLIRIIKTLEKTAGKGNFHYSYLAESSR